MAEKLTLERAIDAFVFELVKLNASWETYIELFEKSKERFDFVMSNGGIFFALVHNAFLDQIALTLAKFCDPEKSCGKDNLSMDKIIELTKAIGENKIAGELHVIAESIKAACANIKKHRDKRLAHLDFNIFANLSKYELPKIYIKDVNKALGELSNFLNKANMGIGKPSSNIYTPLISGGANAIIAFLKQSVRYEQLLQEHKIDPSDLLQSGFDDV